MKPHLNLSINPTYYCNFRCDFCYLTTEQLGDSKRIDLDRLAVMLDEVTAEYSIGHVDLYGGEILVLKEDYIYEIIDLLMARGIDDIVIQTNLSHLPSIVHDPALEFSVSYDFEVREKSSQVLQNMLLMTRPFSLLTLASRRLLDTVTPDMYVDTMNMLGQLKSAEIKPYSTNQANCQDVSFKEYEDFVWAVVTHPRRTFYFENETQIKESYDKTRNAFSDDHIYITPEGNYAVLEFDENDREFFLQLSSLQEYQQWCELEKNRVMQNQICSTCPHFGHCLSEHLRDVKTLDGSCNGFKGLIDRWGSYENGTRGGPTPPTVGNHS